jgi:hypothetical protein
MFVAFWNDVAAELHTGEYLYSIFMPIGCLLVGYLLCQSFTPSSVRAAGKVRGWLLRLGRLKRARRPLSVASSSRWVPSRWLV